MTTAPTENALLDLTYKDDLEPTAEAFKGLMQALNMLLMVGIQHQQRETLEMLSRLLRSIALREYAVAKTKMADPLTANCRLGHIGNMNMLLNLALAPFRYADTQEDS